MSPKDIERAHPRALERFSFFSFFVVVFSLFFSLSKAVLPYKHHTCTAYYRSKDLKLKQYRTAFT